MRFIRTRLLTAAFTTAVLALAAPVGSAGAQELPPVAFPGAGAGSCPWSYAPSGLGDEGATQNQVCGAALVFIGPDIGQVSSVVGPTIIGGVVNAPVTASAGAVGAVGVP
ncbi:MAG TPA: hypothetical protein VE570_00595 [Thermoleophilaceae bacterium]|jgi:hypothetical protein|nr:hypothetical protein [Thermoleophilaceae bacterium]